MKHTDPLRVLFAASEVQPLVKTGGLADVSGSLPPALRRAGVDARVLRPAYPGVIEQIAGEPVGGELKPLPRYPSVARDLALVMDETVAVGPLMAAMRRAGGCLLEDIEMFDVYRGAQAGQGKKSVAFSLVFRAPDRTLTEPEIVKAMDKVQRSCAEQYGAVIR